MMMGIRCTAVAVSLAAACALGGVSFGAESNRPLSVATAPATVSDYRIGPQDMLEINVFQVKDLTGPVQVDSTGNILMPLIGQVPAAGKTPRELSQHLEAELGRKYLRDPRVTVTVKDASGLRVTVDGAVMQPGIYPLPGPTTLLQAVALAKGPDTRIANIKKVAVFREVGGRRTTHVYDLARIRAGAAPDPQILGNDVVVVDTSGTKSFLRDFGGSLGFLSILRPY
jgi:polysaccharide export outer membrane protein